MQRNLSLPNPVIIPQDDRTELRVQATVQSGRRHLDIRVWRDGPSGFAPSRAGMTLDAGELTALQDGITELLNASDGGGQVARVVWDAGDGRRLRAETEPFGTRYLARLGFWQRVRNSWKPVDDGLVIAADRLNPLQVELERFRRWIESTGSEPSGPVTAGPDTFEDWPAPGPDWLTIDGERIALHPRGFRLTCVPVNGQGGARLEIRQWRREDTLWLPEPSTLTLSPADLEGVLSRLLRLNDACSSGREDGCEELRLMDGALLRLQIGPGDGGPAVRADVDSSGHWEHRFSLPVTYLPRLGRALAQGRLLLAAQNGEEETEPAGPVTPSPSPREGQEPEARPVDQVFSFGAQSETPGSILPRDGDLRVVVEGRSSPGSITIPAGVVSTVVAGLHDLHKLRDRGTRIDPTLLCDRQDFAFYGRIGTNAWPDDIELRVWREASGSESIAFDGASLRELIDALLRYLYLAGLPQPATLMAAIPPAAPPSPLLHSGSPAHWRRIAPTSRLETPGPLSPRGDPCIPHPISLSLGSISLGGTLVSLTIVGYRESPRLRLSWEEVGLELAVAELEELLDGVRELYYDALRGRQGRSLSVGLFPSVSVSVHGGGTDLRFLLHQEVDDETVALSVPAGDIPAFLDAAAAATNQQGREIIDAGGNPE